MIKRSLINRRFGDLVVKREIGPDKFFCVCDPEKGKCVVSFGGSRELTRRQLTRGRVTSCEACADRNRRTLNHERPIPPPEATARIELPKCLGCEVRTVGGVKYVAIQPDCKKHSPLYGGMGAEYPRSALAKFYEQGREIRSHRKAGMTE